MSRIGLAFKKRIQNPVKHLKDIWQSFECTTAFCNQIFFYTNAGDVQGEEGAKILHLRKLCYWNWFKRLSLVYFSFPQVSLPQNYIQKSTLSELQVLCLDSILKRSRKYYLECFSAASVNTSEKWRFMKSTSQRTNFVMRKIAWDFPLFLSRNMGLIKTYRERRGCS